MEHQLFVGIEPGRTGRDQSHPHGRRQQQQSRRPARAPPDKKRAQRDEEKNCKQNHLIVQLDPKGTLQSSGLLFPERPNYVDGIKGKR